MNDLSFVFIIIVLSTFFILPSLIWHGCRRCRYNTLTLKSNPLCKECKIELKEGTTYRLPHWDINRLVKERLNNE